MHLMTKMPIPVRVTTINHEVVSGQWSVALDHYPIVSHVMRNCAGVHMT